MGLHQAIISRTLSLPCDCGADDDHPAKLTFLPENGPDEPESVVVGDPSDPSEESDAWTDGNE